MNFREFGVLIVTLLLSFLVRILTGNEVTVVANWWSDRFVESAYARDHFLTAIHWWALPALMGYFGIFIIASIGTVLPCYFLATKLVRQLQ